MAGRVILQGLALLVQLGPSGPVGPFDFVGPVVVLALVPGQIAGCFIADDWGPGSQRPVPAPVFNPAPTWMAS